MDTVIAYLDSLPPDRRMPLAKLRTLILRAAPGLEEKLHNGLPAYFRGATALFTLDAQKSYFALYVAREDVLDRFRARLTSSDADPREPRAGVECGKGSIRFRDLADLPVEIVQEMIRFTIRPPEPATRAAAGRPGERGGRPGERGGRPGERGGRPGERGGRPGAGSGSRPGARPGGRPEGSRGGGSGRPRGEGRPAGGGGGPKSR